MDPIDVEPEETSATGRGGGRLRHVYLHGLELIGSIGVYAHEHRYEQRIIVSLDLEVADTYDGRSDDLADVYDYDQAIGAVRQAVGSGHFNLIETLAERITEACLAAPPVRGVRVAIEKPDVLPGCRAVGIAISRRKP